MLFIEWKRFLNKQDGETSKVRLKKLIFAIKELYAPVADGKHIVKS